MNKLCHKPRWRTMLSCIVAATSWGAGRMGRGGRSVSWRALLGFAIWALVGSPAFSMASDKVGVAQLISPAAADAYYGSATTSTNSTGEPTRPAEVVELAAALKNDPDLIYEYVRNNAETTWTYGLSKGAVGVIIDRSGTAFDQAHLMVELLRQSGFTAGYSIGAISLTGQQFADWSGITSAMAACQLLSSGGIPAVINGATTADCAYGAATVSSIQLGHVVVSAVIGGVTYYFDPAFKAHTFSAGIDLKAAAGLTSGQMLTASAPSVSTTQNGVPLIVPGGGGTTTLNNYYNSLQTQFQSVAPNDAMIDLVGGQKIVQTVIPTGGLRQTSLSYFSSLRVVSGGIPDQYRARLFVQITKARPDGTTPTIISKTVYADDVYGRRLIFAPNFDPTGATFTGALKLLNARGGGPTLGSAPAGLNDDPTYSRGTVTLTVNLPYAANASGGAANGTYMDTVITRPVSYALPFFILHAWGDAGRGLIDKWGAYRDAPLPAAPADCDGCFPSYPRWTGESRRAQMAASWIAQSARAAQINAAIAKSIYAHHYSIGIVTADTTVLTGASTPAVYAVADSSDRIDVETGFSLTSKTATTVDRRAAVHTIAAVIDGLKGTAAGQIADLPEVASVPTRFSYLLSASDVSYNVFGYSTTTQMQQALANTTGGAVTSTTNTGAHDGGAPVMGSAELTTRRNANANAITAYVQAGFSVTAAQDALLGPGALGGAYRKVGTGSYTHDPSRQRGGALVATRYDANGDPVEIAHLLVGPDGAFTAGGVGAQTYLRAQYDPATSADVIKGRFVNRPAAPGVSLVTGELTQNSPATVAVGPGDALPTRIQSQLIWRSGDVPDQTYGSISHTEPQAGWITNWTNSLTFSGSSLEAMGETDGRASVGAIAAFLGMQDLFKSSPSLTRDVAAELTLAWWQGQIQKNIASVAFGTNTFQLLKNLDGNWYSLGLGPKVTMVPLSQTISIARQNPSCYSGPISYAATAGWSYGSTSGSESIYYYWLKLSDGWSQKFRFWQNDIRDSATGSSCSRQRGHRLTKWWNDHETGSGPDYTVALTYASTSPGYAVEQLSRVNTHDGDAIVFQQGGLGGFDNGLSGADLRSVSVSTSGSLVSHTDPAGATTKFDTSIVGQGLNQRYQLNKIYAADNATSAAVQFGYDTLGRVSSVKDAFGVQGTRSAELYRLAFGLRAEQIDRLGNSRVTYMDAAGNPTRTVDPAGNVSAFAYDTRGRLASQTSPEGLVVQTLYDNNSNKVTKTTTLAMPGSAEAGQSINTQAEYEQVNYMPLSTTDANGNKTTYDYGGGYRLNSITGARGNSTIEYTPWGTPAQVKDWWGRYSYAYYTNERLSYTLVNGGYTHYYYDPQGNLTDVVGPLGGDWFMQYDANGRRTLKVDPATSQPSVAARTTYDLVGRVTKVEQGSYASNAFTPILTTTYDYDAVGNKIRETTPAAVTQYSYDALDRVVCTALRMNPAVYGSLPSDACVQSTVGVYGPDRITRNTYDVLGHVTQTETGVGTALAQIQVRYTYSPDGRQTSLTDANGNTSAFAYDGYGRLKRLYYPSPTRGAGVASTTDYEEYHYDAVGSRTSFRKRDGRVINYVYDNRNILQTKDLPGTTTKDISYGYDNGGRLVGAVYTDNNLPVNISYDDVNLTRTEHSSTYGGTDVTSTFDVAGNTIKIAIVGFSCVRPTATYAYDAANRLTNVGQSTFNYCNNQGAETHSLATIAYGPLNRRTSITRRNGTVTEYGYDAAGRLVSLVHKTSSGAVASSQAFTYSPAGEVISQAQVAPNYVWTGHPTSTTNVTHDGLNRDAAMAAAAGYDANGNLISDGVRTFTYDVENRLTGVSGGGAPITLTYDPLGRWTMGGGANYGNAAYDGDRLVYDMNGAGTFYIHADGVDEPIVAEPAVDGSVWSGQTFLHADRQGSIVATSDGVGAMTPYTYGPYGEPQTWAGSRFRYTGQMAIPEAQLYYYKARVYDPVLGRFLQTDPIGYQAGSNMYAYVLGDPVNESDPSGLAPYQMYSTYGEAAQSAAVDIARSMWRTGKEWGTTVFQSSSNQFTYAPITQGTVNSWSPNGKASLEIASNTGEWMQAAANGHGHPYGTPITSDVPDINAADASGLPAFVVDPHGRISTYTPNPNDSGVTNPDVIDGTVAPITVTAPTRGGNGTTSSGSSGRSGVGFWGAVGNVIGATFSAIGSAISSAFGGLGSLLRKMFGY